MAPKRKTWNLAVCWLSCRAQGDTGPGGYKAKVAVSGSDWASMEEGHLWSLTHLCFTTLCCQFGLCKGDTRSAAPHRCLIHYRRLSSSSSCLQRQREFAWYKEMTRQNKYSPGEGKKVHVKMVVEGSLLMHYVTTARARTVFGSSHHACRSISHPLKITIGTSKRTLIRNYINYYWQQLFAWKASNSLHFG